MRQSGESLPWRCAGQR